MIEDERNTWPTDPRGRVSMPGGRLTSDDRHLIAAAVAEGLSYAEIARRLGRPTSTISREVALNRGPDGYRAERAQQAADARAVRHPGGVPDPAGPAPDGSDPIGSDPSGRDPVAVRQLQEQFTEVLMRTGLSRMPAMVLITLYTTDGGSLTAAELVARLGVSPASVSKAIAQLEAQELVRRRPDARSRRDRYVIGDDLWYRSWLASAQMNATLAEAARQAAGVLGAGTPAGARFRNMGEFLSRVGQDMIEAAERWRSGTSGP